MHGASGGVGIAATQLARAYGMRVIGTAGTEKGAALVRAQGAHEVLNHREAGYLDRIMPLTGGHGVDVILEMLANVNLDKDLEVLAFRGRIVSVGNRGRVDIDPRKLMSKDGTILGMTMFNATAEDLRTAHAALVAGLENGALKPVVSREFPLAQARSGTRRDLGAWCAGKDRADSVGISPDRPQSHRGTEKRIQNGFCVSVPLWPGFDLRCLLGGSPFQLFVDDGGEDFVRLSATHEPAVDERGRR